MISAPFIFWLFTFIFWSSAAIIAIFLTFKGFDYDKEERLYVALEILFVLGTLTLLVAGGLAAILWLGE